MMRVQHFAPLLLFILFLGLTSCSEDPTPGYTEEEYAILTEILDLPKESFNYQTTLPAHLPTDFNSKSPEELQAHNQAATLGRVLFYDKKLSKNGEVSCASCHKQNLAFADDVSRSKGFDGRESNRNSLPLGNTIGFETSYGGGSSFSLAGFGWDDVVPNIQLQSQLAFESEIEMGMKMEDIVDIVSKEKYYNILHNNAFGHTGITEKSILDALRSFVNSISSVNSRFDEAIAKSSFNHLFNESGFPFLNSSENRGLNIYINKCSSCHSVDHSFTAEASASNGLDLYPEDLGKATLTFSEYDEGVFKVPFLRNVALTGPYMHDGRFETLGEVIDHYSSGIQEHKNLHPILKDFNNNPMKMNFDDQEKEDLIAFLNTLTDYKLIDDIRFADPFR